jgi:hypothetical protein
MTCNVHNGNSDSLTLSTMTHFRLISFLLRFRIQKTRRRNNKTKIKARNYQQVYLSSVNFSIKMTLVSNIFI